MGSSFSSFSSSNLSSAESDIDDLQQTSQRSNSSSNDRKLPTINKFSHLKTKKDVIEECGEPISETQNNQGFFATCVEEDMFLMTNKNKFDVRLEFSKDKICKVVYLDSNDNVIGIF